VEIGYFCADPAAGVYRMTVRGSYLMVWRMQWPTRQILARRRLREADVALRSLGFGGLAAFRALERKLVSAPAARATAVEPASST